jgi:hypothetical protein
MQGSAVNMRRAAIQPVALLFVLASGVAAADVEIFTRESALVDKNIPNSVRDAFADDDGKAMKSVSVDLNDDKNPEKLIPNEFLCGNGGCPWLVYSTKLHEGYKSIRTYWSLGAGESGTALYQFRRGAYKRQE